MWFQWSPGGVFCRWVRFSFVGMSSGVVADGEAMVAAFDVLDAAIETVNGFDSQMLCTPERVAMLRRYERARRRLSAGEHPLINQLAQEATPQELGGKLSHAIADATLTSRAEASRRVREAADLGQRRALTGEPLAPVLAATAAAQRDGKLGAEHVAVIRRFYHQLPGWIDVDYPRACRSRPGPPGYPVPTRPVGRAGRSARRLPQPRRQLHRRRPRPPARVWCWASSRPTACRRCRAG